jgi:ubiquinone/menaquinone biosynthesis C-methylase UbiE
MKINIGSGNNKIDGFVNVDYDESTYPDYICNIEKDNLPFADNSVDAVIANHILEHLGEGYFHCIKELYRVCKNGAIISIKVPHPRHDTFLADPTHRRTITVMGLQLFSKKFNKLCKEQNYSSSTLGDFFDVDFEILDYKNIPSDWVRIKYPNISIQELEEISNMYNNVISEIHIRMIVIKNEFTI